MRHPFTIALAAILFVGALGVAVWMSLDVEPPRESETTIAQRDVGEVERRDLDFQAEEAERAARIEERRRAERTASLEAETDPTASLDPRDDASADSRGAGAPGSGGGASGSADGSAAAADGSPRKRGEPQAQGPHLDLLETILEGGDKEALRRFLITMTPGVLGEAEAKLLIEQLGETRDRGLINGILGQVGRIGGTAVTEALSQSIGAETSPAVARGVLHTLGRINSDDSIRAVLATLDDDAHKKHHAAAYQALATAKNPLAIGPLSERLSNSNGRTRHEAARALAAIGTNDGWDALLHYAGRGPIQDRSRGRKLIQDTMWRRPDAIPILTDALTREPDPKLRATVVRTLARRRDPKAFTPLLRAARSDQDAGVRLEAVRQMSHLGDKRAIPELATIAQTDANTKVRRTAAWVARRLESK